MIRVISVIILSAFVSQAHATNDASMDKLVDRVASPALHADLDGTTQSKSLAAMPARANAMPSLRSGMQPTGALGGSSCSMEVKRVQDTLKRHGVPPNPFQKLAIASVAERNGICTPAEAGQRAHPAVTSRAINVKEMPGVIAPTGFFDPVGFMAEADDLKIIGYREYELKHGRIGMLAFLGMVMGETVAPLLGGPANVPSVEAFKMTTFDFFWPWVFAATAVHETLYLFVRDENGQWVNRKPEIPGDNGWDPLGLKPSDPKEFLEMQNKELANGRLAMLAAAGIIAQEQVTGQKIFR